MCLVKIFSCNILLILVFSCLPPAAPRSYNNGLIFYDLKTRQAYLPPTVSVSRGRGLASVKFSDKGSIWSTFGKPCECKGSLCGCCAGLKVKQFQFDEKLCANVTYIAPEKEARLEVFLNEKQTSMYGISVDDPDPFCIPIMMGVPMAMCVQMSQIKTQGPNLHMCMDFIVRFASTDMFEMHFQCMKMGLNGLQYLDKEGATVLPPKRTYTDDDSVDYYDEIVDDAENEVTNTVNEIIIDVNKNKKNHYLDKLQSNPDLIQLVDSSVYEQKIQQQMIHLQNVQQMKIESEPSVTQQQIDDIQDEAEKEEGEEAGDMATTGEGNDEYYEEYGIIATETTTVDSLIEAINTATLNGAPSITSTTTTTTEKSKIASATSSDYASDESPNMVSSYDNVTAMQLPVNFEEEEMKTKTTTSAAETVRPIAAPHNNYEGTIEDGNVDDIQETTTLANYVDGIDVITNANANDNVNANNNLSNANSSTTGTGMQQYNELSTSTIVKDNTQQLAILSVDKQNAMMSRLPIDSTQTTTTNVVNTENFSHNLYTDATADATIANDLALMESQATKADSLEKPIASEQTSQLTTSQLQPVDAMSLPIMQVVPEAITPSLALPPTPSPHIVMVMATMPKSKRRRARPNRRHRPQQA